MINLPEKTFFTIPELAIKWKVNVADIEFLVDSDELLLADKHAALHGKRHTIFKAKEPSFLTNEERNFYYSIKQIFVEREIAEFEEIVYVEIPDNAIGNWDDVMEKAKQDLPDSLIKVVLIQDVQELEKKYGNEEIVKDFGKRQTQLNILSTVILNFDYSPHEIPDGGKAKIEKYCLEKHKDNFTKAGFEKAWKVGRKQNLFKMANHDKYL